MSNPETVYAAPVRGMVAGEAIEYRFSFALRLAAGQTLAGTPTVTASPAGLTIGAPALNTEAFDDGEIPANTVAVNEAVVVRITAGPTRQPYELICLCGTSDGQIVGGKARLIVY